jgi:transposase
MSTHYSPDFKQSIIQKISMPRGPSILEVSEEIGVHCNTIRNWLRNHASSLSMNKSKKWTPERKLEAIIKTAAMSEHELGEYLRANGLHSSQIEQWKQEFYNAQSPSGRPRVNPELTKLKSKEKELSKDLRRKDRALAEMSARIVLLKKSRLIWGDGEDDE